MSDIVYRLQALTPTTQDMISTVAAETIEEACGEILKLRGLLTEARRARDAAADETERLRREVQEARAALQPFAALGNLLGPEDPHGFDMLVFQAAGDPNVKISGNDCRRAAAALKDHAP